MITDRSGQNYLEKKSVNNTSSAINRTCIELGLNLDVRDAPPSRLQDVTTRSLHNTNSYGSGKLSFILHC